jgi:hypothetical protein
MVMCSNALLQASLICHQRRSLQFDQGKILRTTALERAIDEHNMAARSTCDSVSSTCHPGITGLTGAQVAITGALGGLHRPQNIDADNDDACQADRSDIPSFAAF